MTLLQQNDTLHFHIHYRKQHKTLHRTNADNSFQPPFNPKEGWWTYKFQSNFFPLSPKQSHIHKINMTLFNLSRVDKPTNSYILIRRQIIDYTYDDITHRRSTWTVLINSSKPSLLHRSKSHPTAQVESNPLQLLRFDQRVSSSYFLSPDRLEIEAARVLLRVPVGPAERDPAPALEPGQPNPLPACRAPVRPNRFRYRLGRRSYGYDRRRSRYGLRSRERHDGRQRRRRRRRGGESGFDGGFG